MIKVLLTSAIDTIRVPELMGGNKSLHGGKIQMTNFTNGKETQQWFCIPCNGSAFFLESVADPNLVIQVPTNASSGQKTPAFGGSRRPLTNHDGSLFILNGSHIL